jgi:hypothetical protein
MRVRSLYAVKMQNRIGLNMEQADAEAGKRSGLMPEGRKILL